MKFQDAVDAVRRFLVTRRQAYINVFSGKMYAPVVLRDLAKFCRAYDSTFNPDTHVAARLDGRREVWLRIQKHLNMTEEEMWKAFGRPDLEK